MHGDGRLIPYYSLQKPYILHSVLFNLKFEVTVLIMNKQQSYLFQQLLQLGDITYIRKSKANIVAAFETFDAAALTYLLNDDTIYQDATKAVFIEKLQEVFAEFIEKGDIKLEAFPGNCKLCSCDSTGKSGYTFVGNNSRKHLDLIFKEEGEEIVDIFTCDDFKSDVMVVVSNEIEIDIRADEYANFTPSLKYLLTSAKCESAVTDLLSDGNKIIARSDYLYWLEKYRDLSKTFRFSPLRYRKYYNFSSLYSSVRFFFDWITYEPQLEIALLAFQNMIIENESEIINWLVQYEPLWNHVIGRYYEYDKEDNQLEAVVVNYNPELLLHVSECALVLNFNELFEKHYWPAFHKYRTTTEEELYDVKMSSDEWTQAHSLTWHLKQCGYL